MLSDEEIHGRWNSVDQRYADGCEPGDTHDEVSIHALINHGPIISDPGTLYVQDNAEALAQAWDEGFEAGEQAGLMPSMHGDAVNPYRDGSK